MNTAAIIVAAGRGRRSGLDHPKQFATLGDKTVLEHTVRSMSSHKCIQSIIIVHHPDDQKIMDQLDLRGTILTPGGKTRAASVYEGLLVLPEATEHVLIHDAARPFVSHVLIDEVLEALKTSKAAAPGLPIVDALWHGDDGHVDHSVPRTNLYRAQTPQGFRKTAIIAAHERALKADIDPKDDVEAALAAGLKVAITKGDDGNFKITYPDDILRAERILNNKDTAYGR
ncbi:MAG: 2-C-methyl-D-erythritol 4-phosphate cytidylyltransferase [Halocynthiibacter sp.]